MLQAAGPAWLRAPVGGLEAAVVQVVVVVREQAAVPAAPGAAAWEPARSACNQGTCLVSCRQGASMVVAVETRPVPAGVAAAALLPQLLAVQVAEGLPLPAPEPWERSKRTEDATEAASRISFKAKRSFT